MIGFTKLLCGTATVREALTYAREPGQMPRSMMQFAENRGPLVVWNVTRRCNLECRHCYYPSDAAAEDRELGLEQGMRLIADLKAAEVPVLLFSGGEPLLREELFAWATGAKALGIQPVLSTNGTLITDRVASKLVDAGFAYVGVSLDGTEQTHDAFRGERGAFQRSVAGLREAKKVGLRTGVRFTVTADNLAELPRVLEFVEAEGIPRFCLYHLVYSGRGSELREQDLTVEQRRRMLDFLIERTLDWHRRGVQAEILTVDNHADGAYIAGYVRRNMPERLEEVRGLMEMHGGCSAGTKFASIDAAGNVHPCQFWGHVSLGNVTECTFREIWNDLFNPLMRALKVKAPHLTGSRCRQCAHKVVCAGCRVRAEAVTGDAWADDPACYLTESERSAPSEPTR